MKGRICAVIEAGDAPGRNPLLPALAAELADRDFRLLSWDPTNAVELPPDAPEADLYLLKADDQAALSVAGFLHDSGAACLNSFPATEAAHDKARTLARLAAAGLPVPPTRLVARRNELDEALAVRRWFVKPVRGAHGASARALGPGEGSAAGPGPWLIQEIVEETDRVLKVYGVGHRAAIRRLDFQPGVVDAVRHPVRDPPPELIDMAVQAAALAGLICFGADFVMSRDGPVMVDLNAFPGYRDVPEAAGWIADAAVETLRAG